MTSKSFLEQLYYGNISPMERVVRKNSKVYKISELVSKKNDEFRSKLSDELQREFDKVISLETSQACEMELEAFIYGCRFIFRILGACAGDDNNDFPIDELLRLEGGKV